MPGDAYIPDDEDDENIANFSTATGNIDFAASIEKVKSVSCFLVEKIALRICTFESVLNVKNLPKSLQHSFSLTILTIPHLNELLSEM